MYLRTHLAKYLRTLIEKSKRNKKSYEEYSNSVGQVIDQNYLGAVVLHKIQ